MLSKEAFFQVKDQDGVKCKIMNETSKSHYARLRNGDYNLLRGSVLDVGCALDPLKLPPPNDVVGWDWEDGDAQYLKGVKDESFDVVYSSHCAEHLLDFPTGLSNWARVCKEGGHIYIVVPSFSLYERYQWPSIYNPDHKSSFDLLDVGLRPKHPFYAFKEMRQLGLKNGLTLIDARLEADNYDFSKMNDKKLDQTMGKSLAQCVFIYLKA